MGSALLSTQDKVHFTDTVQSLAAVTNTGDYRTLLANEIRQLIPFELMVCGVGEIRQGGVYVQHLVNLAVPDAYLGRIINRQGKVETPIIRRWLHTCQPQYYEKDHVKGPPVDEGWRALFDSYHLDSLFAFGQKNDNGNLCSYICLYNVMSDDLQKNILLSNLLMPSIHSCMQKIYVRQQQNAQRNSIQLARLTRREQDIAHWVSLGKTNWEIAIILGISALTVKTHVQNILGKLQLSSRTELIINAAVQNTQLLSA